MMVDLSYPVTKNKPRQYGSAGVRSFSAPLMIGLAARGGYHLFESFLIVIIIEFCPAAIVVAIVVIAAIPAIASVIAFVSIITSAGLKFLVTFISEIIKIPAFIASLIRPWTANKRGIGKSQLALSDIR